MEGAFPRKAPIVFSGLWEFLIEGTSALQHGLSMLWTSGKDGSRRSIERRVRKEHRKLKVEVQIEAPVGGREGKLTLRGDFVQFPAQPLPKVSYLISGILAHQLSRPV
jgi:hypothetical protein